MVAKTKAQPPGLTRSKRTRRQYSSAPPQPKRPAVVPYKEWAPKKRAAVGRTVKIAAYYILGYLLAIGAFFVVYLLTQQAVDQGVIQITGFIVASIMGGIHKAINWKDAGVDPSLVPLPPTDAALPATISLPTVINKEEGS